MLNNLSGSLPNSIGNCSALRILRIGCNKLSGVIPTEIGMLNRLQILGLGVNRFHGKVFPFLLNFTQLRLVSLVLNSFEGSIPEEIGLRVANLGGLRWSFCRGEFVQLRDPKIFGKLFSALIC